MVLTGEGADEVFAGYDIFKEARGSAFLRAPARFAHPAASLPQALSLSARPQAAEPGISRRLLRHRSRPDRRSACSRHRPRLRGTAAAKMFYSGDLRADAQGLRCGRRTRRQSAARNFPAGIRCIRRNISKPLSCCPATSCRARATAWPWRMASKAAFPSSTIAWSNSRRASPPAMKLKGLDRKAHPARGDQGPSAGLDRQAAPSSPIARRTASPSSARRRLPMSRRRLRAQAIADCGLFNPKAVAKLYEKCQRQGHFRVSRQCRLRRHPVDPALVPRIFRQAARSVHRMPPEQRSI